MISFGIDIGTTTLRAVATQIKLDGLGGRTSESLGNPLCVYTPYVECRNLDEKTIKNILLKWVKDNGLPDPDVGTLLFTGEAQRAPNVSVVGEHLSQLWSSLLTAQLDPKLESRIAAFGAGIVELSAQAPGKCFMHIDIGGGTSNFARVENGEIIDTSCLNLGCRKWIVDSASNQILHATGEGRLLEKLVLGVSDLKIMDEEVASKLCDKIIELMRAHIKGLTPSELLPFIVVPWTVADLSSSRISISGGVAECGEKEDLFYFNDIGPLLTRKLKEAFQPIFSPQLGRATALGVATFGFQVSGGSIHAEGQWEKSLRNIPLYFESQFKDLKEIPKTFALAMDWKSTEGAQIEELAQGWARKLGNMSGDSRVLFLFRPNIAKTFGYYFSKGRKPINALMLDNIEFDASEVGLRTVDVTLASETGRYLVTLKTLRTF